MNVNTLLTRLGLFVATALLGAFVTSTITSILAPTRLESAARDVPQVVSTPAPDGSGETTLTVPKGTNSGARLRLKGRGMPDAKGQRGDLYARLMIVLPEGDASLEAFAAEQKAQRPYAPKRRG